MHKRFTVLALALLLPGALAAQEPAKAPDAPQAAAPAAQKNGRLAQLNDERDEFRAQYELAAQKQKNKIADLEAEYNKISLENKLLTEKAAGELARVRAELDRLSAENKLADEKMKAQSAQQNADLQRISAENKLADENSKKALAEVSAQLARIKAANDLQTEKQRELALLDMKEKNAIELEMKRMDLKERQLRFKKAEADARADQLNADLALRGKKEEWKKEANTEPVYKENPFDGSTLVLSDRRITMNGPIVYKTADDVTERIHYFNNISTQPVFIVIDSSPGGSVMSGYRILKAMQASRAPVYVVVKSFAASMAATITTLADKSFVYPNAIILHHQMSTMNWGNMTQLKEQLDMAREWEVRLMKPVAKKIGLDMEEFRKRMYAKNSDGDWEEFGDKAVELKWAGTVVDRIEETGLVKNPDFDAPEAAPARRSEVKEAVDEKGQRFAALPRLQPFDFYYLYNPDKYYR